MLLILSLPQCLPNLQIVLQLFYACCFQLVELILILAEIPFQEVH